MRRFAWRCRRCKKFFSCAGGCEQTKAPCTCAKCFGVEVPECHMQEIKDERIKLKILIHGGYCWLD